MRGEVPKRALVVLGLVASACTGSEGGPATAPSATDPSPASTVTTTDPSTTIPVGEVPPAPTDRIAEIEAIFAELEFRRLDALYRQDEEAFRSVFANEAYHAATVEALGEITLSKEAIAAPTIRGVIVTVAELIVDSLDCLAARVVYDLSSILGPDDDRETLMVLTPVGDMWGLAYAGEGWLCEGPHPFELSE